METKKNVYITVSGDEISGKNRLSYMLKKFLRENDFEVEFDGSLHFIDENKFDESMSSNLNQAIEHIKDTRKIKLKVITIKRD